jgi:hypothetical protein
MQNQNNSTERDAEQLRLRPDLFPRHPPRDFAVPSSRSSFENNGHTYINTRAGILVSCINSECLNTIPDLCTIWSNRLQCQTDIPPPTSMRTNPSEHAAVTALIAAIRAAKTSSVTFVLGTACALACPTARTIEICNAVFGVFHLCHVWCFIPCKMTKIAQSRLFNKKYTCYPPRIRIFSHVPRKLVAKIHGFIAKSTGKCRWPGTQLL